MKKLIAGLLCLMLLCTGAFAEKTARQYTIKNPQTATSVTGMFTFEVPQEYHVFNAEYAQEFLSSHTAADLTELLDASEEKAQALLNMLSSIDFSAADYVYAEDFSSNINIQVAYDTGMSQEFLVEYASTLNSILTEQTVAMGLTEEDCCPMGVAPVGSNPMIWYGFSTNLHGVYTYQYMTCDDNGTLFTVSMTGVPQGVEMAFLESFTVVK